MFHLGFAKTAATLVTMTPEEYYEHVSDKDKYVGALLGAATGAAAGGYKKRTARGALIGTGVGAAAGGSLGHLAGKGLRSWQAKRIRRLAAEHGLRTTPQRGRASYEPKED